LSKSFPSDRKYTYNERNNRVIKEYSIEYSKAYHDALNGMVEKQMRSSILDVGSFWYTAWVDAGQPDMKNLTRTDQSLKEKKQIEEEEKKYQKGQILGRPEN
jgi:protein tyrosine phosphatase